MKGIRFWKTCRCDNPAYLNHINRSRAYHQAVSHMIIRNERTRSGVPDMKRRREVKFTRVQGTSPNIRSSLLPVDLCCTRGIEEREEAPGGKQGIANRTIPYLKHGQEVKFQHVQANFFGVLFAVSNPFLWIALIVPHSLSFCRAAPEEVLVGKQSIANRTILDFKSRREVRFPRVRGTILSSNNRNNLLPVDLCRT